MIAYEYITNAFKDVAGDIRFIEFPQPGDDPLDRVAEGEPRLRMVITRGSYRYGHEFPLLEYEFLLDIGEIDRPINKLKELIEKAFTKQMEKPGN